jgi:hypothetical protein
VPDWWTPVLCTGILWKEECFALVLLGIECFIGIWRAGEFHVWVVGILKEGEFLASFEGRTIASTSMIWREDSFMFFGEFKCSVWDFRHILRITCAWSRCNLNMEIQYFSN